MFANCSNPDCRAPFDYREGRLIPVRKPALNGQTPAGHHGIEHFWLCGKCSGVYVFEHHPGVRMKIKSRVTELRENTALALVTAA
jgi:hypothetical protein